MWQRFDAQARRVVSSAQQEAARRGDAVTAEGLLLALLRENGTVAARALDRLGVSWAALRDEVGRQVTPPEPEAPAVWAPPAPFSPGAKAVIDLCYEEAHALRDTQIGTEHLLLGLIRDRDSLTGRALMQTGVTDERLRAEIIHLKGAQAAPSGIWDRVPKDCPWFWAPAAPVVQEVPTQKPPARKEQPVMWQRFTEGARKVVFFAQEEAGRSGRELRLD